MAYIRATFIALAFGLVALPAVAGGISFDLPRLDFPAPGTDTSRDCTAVTLPGGTQTCAQTGK
ncbi:MAG: hypothetical protein B7Z02_03585 [Rhodobacterales bacterium 32-67-9]|nr:MAG: hypothetical protein B7Z02_03585 [Rhodobacterales bacterium 32-67-9]